MTDSKVPEAWGRDTWTMHRQPAYKELATSEEFPPYLRATFFAYATVKPSGHARLDQGVLAHALGSERGSIWRPADPRSVTKAVRRAVEKGLLDPTSKALCLVVPHSMVAGGKGDPLAPCDRHPKRSKRPPLRVIS